jgi:YegS/Rv2252/BmrU family lipid kinase
MAASAEPATAATWFAVLNPVSGGGRARRQRAHIESALREYGVAHVLRTSEHAGHALQLAREAARAGHRRFIAIGGDGTLNELLNGALSAGVEFGEPPLFALVPVGRGDDWARTFAIPRAAGEAIALIARGRSVLQDVGVAAFDHAGAEGKRHFINVAGAGFDAHVVAQTQALRLGPLTYLVGLLRGFMTYRAPRMKVASDAHTREEPLFLAFAALGRYCGGGMHVAPGASPDDGLFDVVTVGAVGKGELMVNLRRLFDGTLPEYHKVSVTRAARVRVESEPPARVEADGELLGSTPVTFSVLPRAVRVIVA